MYYIIHDATEIVATFKFLSDAMLYMANIKENQTEYEIVKVVYSEV